MPTEVVMVFKGNTRLTRVVITHGDTYRMDVDLGNQIAFTREFVLPLQDMGAGTYVVKWRALGSDGHALDGLLSFTVN